MIKCPLCPNPLKPNLGTLVKCVRGHRFYVKWGEETERKLVLAVTPAEKVPQKEGDEFPIADGEEF